MRIIGLSATVSNVEDFSKWIESVRGDTTLVVSEKRPVPLEQHVLVQADDHTEPELIDLYRRDKDGNQTDKLNAQLVSRSISSTARPRNVGESSAPTDERAARAANGTTIPADPNAIRHVVGP